MRKITKIILAILGTISIGAICASCDSKNNSENENNSQIEQESWLKLSHSGIELKEGDSVLITATSDLSLEDIVWTSEDPSIATVVDGSITAVSEGRVNICATLGDLSAICIVEVTAAENDVSGMRLVLNLQKKYLTVGESIALNATLYNHETVIEETLQYEVSSDALTVTPSGENNSFAVKAEKPGIATITISYEHLTAIAEFVVKSAEAVSLPIPEIKASANGLAFSIDEQYADILAHYEVQASNGEYSSIISKDSLYTFSEDMLKGSNIVFLELYIKAVASDEALDYISSTLAEIQVLVVQDEVKDVIYEGEFLTIVDDKIIYNENIVGATLISEVDGEEIELPPSGSNLQDLGDFKSLNFYAVRDGEKIAYLGGYIRDEVLAVTNFYGDWNKVETWDVRITTSVEAEKGTVYTYRVPESATRAFPMIVFTVDQDLSKLKSFSYDVKVTADTTATSTITESDLLYFLPNLPGSAEDRGDSYALTSALIGANGLSIADGWQNIQLTGLSGTQTVGNNKYAIIDNGDGTYSICLTFINRWNAASGSSPKNFNLSITNLQFEFEEEKETEDE